MIDSHDQFAAMAASMHADTVREQAAALGKLRAALSKYGRHAVLCEVYERGRGNGGTCTCGWDKVFEEHVL